MELKLQAELSKIVNQYDSLAPAEEAEAVKILMGKISISDVFNWQPIFNEMAMGCNVFVPVGTVDDFCFVLSACFENAHRAESRTLFYKLTVTWNFEIHFGEAKVSY